MIERSGSRSGVNLWMTIRVKKLPSPLVSNQRLSIHALSNELNINKETVCKEVKEAATAVLKALTSEDYQGCFQSWE
ncbi:hypothetical protein Trydic_g8136 [Trypoxylus dichotomus]